MKIALCLSGLAEGKNDIGRNSGGIDYSFPHFKEHFFDKYDVDVFVHSWSTDNIVLYIDDMHHCFL